MRVKVVNEIYNLNVPDLPYEAIKGVKKARLSNDFVCRIDYSNVETDDGSKAYKVIFDGEVENTDPGCDSVLHANGWASLSVLTWKMVPDRNIEIPEIKL